VAHAAGVDVHELFARIKPTPPPRSERAASRRSASGTPGRRTSMALPSMCRLCLATPPRVLRSVALVPGLR
jgi:hypothetical protein